MDKMPLNARFLLAASIMAIPLAGALAQSNPTGNLGSNQSTTASPGTADNKAASGLNTADVNAKPPIPPAGAMNSTTPGATGTTVVPGSTSTVAGDKANTAESKTGATAGTGR
jgi:hypothetical protein